MTSETLPPSKVFDVVLQNIVKDVIRWKRVTKDRQKKHLVTYKGT